MNVAIGLLMTALQLLTAVSTTPNLPQDFKDNAIRVANIEINEANRQLADYQTTSIIEVIPEAIELPSSGSTMVTPDDKSNILVTLVKRTEKDKENSVPFGA